MSESKVKSINEEFDEEFGDLLSDVVPTDSGKSDVVSEAKTTPPSKPVTESKKDIITDEFADETHVGVADFGKFVSSVPVPRFKASKDTKSRFAILSKSVQNIKMHYAEGIGSFLCFEDKCCEFEGFPKVRYLIPVVQYSVNKAGQIIDKNLELKVLSIGAEQYQALVDAVQFSGRDVTDVDIIATCSDEQYQKLTFAADASKGATWKGFETAKEIVSKYKANKDKLYMAVAKRVSPETYLMKKGIVSNSIPPSVGNFSNIDEALDV